MCLDEPFGSLDALTRADTQRWLAGVLARTPRTVLLVTHDVEEAALLADRVLVMSPRPGRIIAEFTVAAERGPEGRDPGHDGVREVRAAALAALGGHLTAEAR
jgi:NitT/TauT family transport system ATP-binding protein